VRRGHLEALKPVCPVCRARGAGEVRLGLATVFREEGGHVVEGALRCASPACQREYPILDGIPLIVADLRSYVAGNVLPLLGRDDLSPETESLLGDCFGPGSAFDVTRQHLSSYAWDHYRDLETGPPRESAVLQVLARGLERAGEVPAGPALDAGCAVGRTTFELAARLDRLTLGVDLHFAMLRLAARALREGRVRFPLRRVGVVYDRRDFAADLPAAERVDFWACDAGALPFPAGTFAAVAGLNLLDCVASPHDVLAALPGLLAAGGKAILTTPYDWSPGATPLEAWIGGHSQRGEHRGASEPVLRALLTPGAHPASVEGLRIVAEEADLPWRVRLHDRSWMEYRVHLVVAEKV
jgi:SAM-dependent methyltransferase/uncharacterized protein YbaR (Trm112 family)